MTKGVPEVLATPETNKMLYIQDDDSTILPDVVDVQWSEQLIDGSPATACTTNQSARHKKNAMWIHVQPDVLLNQTDAGTPCPASATGKGWIFETSFETWGALDGGWTFDVYTSDTAAANTGYVRACVYRVAVSGGAVTASTLFFTATGTTDVWVGGTLSSQISATDPCGAGCGFTASEKYLTVEYYIDSDGGANSSGSVISFGEEQCGTPYPRITIASFLIPENVAVFIALAPLIPFMIAWMKKRKEQVVYA